LPDWGNTKENKEQRINLPETCTLLPASTIDSIKWQVIVCLNTRDFPEELVYQEGKWDSGEATIFRTGAFADWFLEFVKTSGKKLPIELNWDKQENILILKQTEDTYIITLEKSHYRTLSEEQKVCYETEINGGIEGKLLVTNCQNTQNLEKQFGCSDNHGKKCKKKESRCQVLNTKVHGMLFWGLRGYNHSSPELVCASGKFNKK
jgi:hypothetical protein